MQYEQDNEIDVDDENSEDDLIDSDILSEDEEEDISLRLSDTSIDNSLVEIWSNFIMNEEIQNQILEITSKLNEKNSVNVDYYTIIDYDTEFAAGLLREPEKYIKSGERAIMNAIENDTSISSVEHSRVNLRIHHLPSHVKVDIRAIRKVHLWNFISVEGIIKSAFKVQPLTRVGAFACSVCGSINHVVQNEFDRTMLKPMICSNCESQAARARFTFLPTHSVNIDYQRLKLSESPDKLSGSPTPEDITLVLYDDTTGTVNPGERIVVNGILKSMPLMSGKDMLKEQEVFIEVNSIEYPERAYDIEINDEEEQEIKSVSSDPDLYDHMIQSIAPSIKGHDVIKETILLQIFGGVRKKSPDGTITRGDIHILLMGDPGVAKSQLLRYVARLSPKGHFASGMGTSAAGLTAAVTRDERNRYYLEAGTLVLSNGGIACIDELDKMKKEDASNMHEAMEQQTVTISKAGISTSLSTECAILAAANPKTGRFVDNPNDSYFHQINLSPPMISRFDSIFFMFDRPNEKHDRDVADHILQLHRLGELQMYSRYAKEEMPPVGDKSIEPYFDDTFMRKYVAYAKENIFPVLTEAATKRIEEFFWDMRKNAYPKDGNLKKNGPVSITMRQLEALIRLSEASARVRLSNAVELDDAERAINILMQFLEQATRNEEGAIDIDILTGTSSPQRDLMYDITNMVNELSQLQPDGTADAYEVIEEVTALGYDKHRVETHIEKMKSAGQLFEPITGRLSTV